MGTTSAGGRAMDRNASSTIGTTTATERHADGTPVKFETAGWTIGGVTQVQYFADHCLTTCNESLREFYPDDYWSWPKRLTKPIVTG